MRKYLDRRLKLQMLRIADAIDTQGSILKAAAALGMSQPAVTKSLQELEEITQARLFDRHAKGVRVTAAGSRLIGSGRRILAEVVRLDDDLDQLARPEGGLVAVGALPVAATGILPGVLIRLRRQYPDIQVRLQQGRTEELLPMLASGELDMIVGRLYEPARPDGLVRETLWAEPISILARSDHPIFGGPCPDQEAIRRYELVLPTVTQRVGQEIEHVLAQLHLEPTSSLRSNSYGFIREMLHGTDVLSAMPRLMMVGDLLRSTLKVVPLPMETPERPAGLILSRVANVSAASAAFVDCLRGYIAQILSQGLMARMGVQALTAA